MNESNATKKDIQIALLEHEKRLMKDLDARDKEQLKHDDARRREVDKLMIEMMNEIKRHPAEYELFINKSIDSLKEFIKTEYATKEDIKPLQDDREERRQFNKWLFRYAITVTVGILVAFLYKIWNI